MKASELRTKSEADLQQEGKFASLRSFGGEHSTKVAYLESPPRLTACKYSSMFVYPSPS